MLNNQQRVANMADKCLRSLSLERKTRKKEFLRDTVFPMVGFSVALSTIYLGYQINAYNE